MSDDELPPHLLTRAVKSGREFGWRQEDFLVALHEAALEGFACIGGQFQYALPDGACELYWLNADSLPHTPSESWWSYVKRSEEEVKKGYELLLRTINFDAEVNKFDFLREKIAGGISLDEYLIFIAYFKSSHGVQ
ncbi:MAG TPA: hypothetical protein VFF41_05980 [Gallionella sp.]|nr:hypothetical protein [Gallionella sp.]